MYVDLCCWEQRDEPNEFEALPSINDYNTLLFSSKSGLFWWHLKQVRMGTTK
jgi:hypothetical protein